MLGFISEIIIEEKIQMLPIAKLSVNCSSVNITENRIPKTDSREKIKAAVGGGVFFCPAACKSTHKAVHKTVRYAKVKTD